MFAYSQVEKLNEAEMCVYNYVVSDSNVIMSQCIQVDIVPIGTILTCRVKL